MQSRRVYGAVVESIWKALRDEGSLQSDRGTLLTRRSRYILYWIAPSTHGNHLLRLHPPEESAAPISLNKSNLTRFLPLLARHLNAWPLCIGMLHAHTTCTVNDPNDLQILSVINKLFQPFSASQTGELTPKSHIIYY